MVWSGGKRQEQGESLGLSFPREKQGRMNSLELANLNNHAKKFRWPLGYIDGLQLSCTWPWND